MDDLIRRSDAINLCEKWRNRTNEHHDKNGWYIADTLLKAIKELPSADRPQGWIPCSERLPDKSGEYLAYSIISHVPDHIGDQNIRKDTTVAYYSRSFNEWFGNGVEKVLAWQPKPEPWKGENCEVSCR